MSLLLMLDNEPITLPSTLVDIAHFIVYIKTEENLLVQLNQRCMIGNCGGEINDPVVEL